jgi:hypothetical protein
MLTLVTTAARFLPKRKFHIPKNISASLKPGRLNVVQIESDAMGEDGHFVGSSISFLRAFRTISPSETSCFLASRRSHDRMCLSRWISRRCFDLAMNCIVASGNGAVNDSSLFLLTTVDRLNH